MTDASVAQMIESSWEKIESRITLEDAMTSFINQKLDQCGATICLSAFELVSQALDPGGFVRRINKSEDSNLSSVLTNSEGPWVEQNKNVDRQWDYTGTWLSNIDKISENAQHSDVDWQKYYAVNSEDVFKRFCEPVEYTFSNKKKIQRDSILKRYDRAQFDMNGAGLKEDPDYSWSPLKTMDKEHNARSNFTGSNYKLCKAPSHGSLKTRGYDDRVIQRWETKTVKDFNDDKHSTDNIEPYWMFDMRNKKEWSEYQLKGYEYNQKSTFITPIQKPDMVMEITYTCPKLYFQKKIIVMVEIDGEDKTYQIERTNENSTRHDYFKINPAKLALKLMQSTSVQAVLQPHTYNIRTNFYSYLKQIVDRSLQNTTNFEIPSFQDILNRLTKSNLEDSGLDDFHQLTRTIHIIWHLFRAHVKVAFLIYMREVHEIDIRDGLSANNTNDQLNDNMKDHFFFINFTGNNIPDELSFTDKMSKSIRKYLENKLMLQSTVKIKVFDMTEGNTQGSLIQSKWTDAPIMSTKNSNMKDWKARICSGKIPNLPNEDTTSVPVTYATIQRVNMNKLCEIVKKAASKSFISYSTSRLISMKRDGIKRRDFPDRCYLTRKQQLDRNKWWNRQLGEPIDSNLFTNDEKCKLNELRPHGIALRRHTEDHTSDLIELNFGYEKPNLKKDYRQMPTDISNCTWDQVDIRMHYFYNEMEDLKIKSNSEDWKKYADGMWYTEDYILFFRMLQSLQENFEIHSFTGKNCAFTCEPDWNDNENLEINMKRAVESTKYRFRLHNFKARETDILKNKDLINLFWQSKQSSNNIEKIEIKNFVHLTEVMDLLYSEDLDQNLFELRKSIESVFVEYIRSNNILIPIISDDTNPKQKSRKSRSKTNRAKKFCLGKIELDDCDGDMKYKVSYVGYDKNFNYFSVSEIISAFQLYAREKKLVIDNEVDLFFESLIEDFENEFQQDETNTVFDLKKNDRDDVDESYLNNIHQELENFRIITNWNFQNENVKYCHSMPEQSPQQDLAYHIYSILCFFFNCRDDGACRYRWEEWLLEYFGAGCKGGTQSDFHKFEFQKVSNSTPDYEYYNQTWFQMCFFLEHNFRNAISALHYKLFEMDNSVGYFPDVNNQPGLQTIARKVYNRENRLLNNRSSFDGLGNVSVGLSFRKYNPRTKVNLTLRDRIMSQLDDELPELDPTLATYVRKFRIPDSELFLRIIKCPNILALRELARQHMSIEPQKHMREVLQFFEPAIQSEIEVMLKFVQTDESVYVNTPEAHPSKRLILTETQLLKWMRDIVNCSSFSSSLGMLNNVTPLQCKYDMFFNPSVFHVIKNLFCTQDLLNFGCQRPLKFILLQLALVNKIIRCESINDCLHANDSLYLALKKTEVENVVPVSLTFNVNIQDEENKVPCTINTSRRGWPRRDLNRISKIVIKRNVLRDNSDTDKDDDRYDKTSNSDTDEESDKPHTLETEIMELFNTHQISVEIQHNKNTVEFEKCDDANTVSDVHDEMTDEELRKWMLLAYARPCVTLKSEINVSVTQESFVRNPSCKSECEDIELYYQEETREGKRVLVCCIHRVEEHIYFERYEKSYQSEERNDFPLYVQALLPQHIDRKLIYIPKECAVILRKKKWPLFFTHEVDGQVYKWRPVFTGLRTWCWKRLLVKMIFLHSFGKVLTRTKTLVSLYTDEKDLKNKDILKVLKKSNEATLETFGNLNSKENWLPKEYKERHHKKLQKEQVVLLSLHKYKSRTYKDPYSQTIRNVLECCKYTTMQKQLKWMLYATENMAHLKTAMSCRFMRIDRRLEDDELTKNAYTIAPHEQFYVYRDCLYFESEKQHMVVNANNSYFVKFPTSFAIRAYRNENDKSSMNIFVCETKNDSLKIKFFLTAFDTRRYNWFKNTPLDTKEDTEVIQNYKKISLDMHGDHAIRTVSDQFHDGLQWAVNLENDLQSQIQALEPGYAITSLEDSSTLFTLPDFYMDAIEHANLRHIFTTRINVSKSETEEVDLQTINKYTWWLHFRAKSKFLVFEKSTLTEAPARVFDDEFLAAIMKDVTRTLQPSASESMKH